MEPFIGQIQAFGFNFAPRGWAFCDGQLLPISQNQALFSLIGTTYGGDGITTFALPDLRGRVILHPGTGPGLSPVTWGQRAGFESTTLTLQNLPAHNHLQQIAVNDGDATLDDPRNAYLGNSGSLNYATAPATGAFLNSGSTAPAGGSLPFNIRNPFLGVYTCIALIGIFPSRN